MNKARLLGKLIRSAYACGTAFTSRAREQAVGRVTRPTAPSRSRLVNTSMGERLETTTIFYEPRA